MKLKVVRKEGKGKTGFVTGLATSDFEVGEFEVAWNVYFRGNSILNHVVLGPQMSIPT